MNSEETLHRLPFFPKAFEGETLFGVLSRYHRLSGNPSSRRTMFELFGSANPVPASAFPGGIGELCSRLPDPKPTPRHILLEQTLAPYYVRFVVNGDIDKILARAIERGAASVKLSLGLVASGLGAADLLRYCTKCANDDIQRSGIATWHRVHQVPGTLVCPFHGDVLQESRALEKMRHRHEFFLPGEHEDEFRPTVHRPTEDQLSLLLSLARVQREFVDNPIHRFSQKEFRADIAKSFAALGLLTDGSRIRDRWLTEHFASHFAPLRHIAPYRGLIDKAAFGNSWLLSLARARARNIHPLKHAMLRVFLISAVNVDRAPIVAPVENTRRTLVGDLWVERRVSELLQSGLSLRKVSDRTGISVSTVAILAQRTGHAVSRRPKTLSAVIRSKIILRLNSHRRVDSIARQCHVTYQAVSRVLRGNPELAEQRRFRISEARSQRERELFSRLVRTHRSAHVKEVRKMAPATYTWLYRHDRDWLEGHSPHVKAAKNPKPRVDWHARDEWLLKQIRGLAKRKRVGSPAGRTLLSKAKIGRVTGRLSWIQKSLNKLPGSKRAIDQATHTPR